MNKISLEQALAQNPQALCPEHILASLGLVEVAYTDFTGTRQIGQIVVAESVRTEVEIFFELANQLAFPIHRVAPAVAYGWDDERLMAGNITSGFNYRLIAGTDQISKHGLGLAFDVNPVQNPYIRYEQDQIIRKPAGSTYDILAPGTLTPHHELVGLMLGLGWTWGGDWTEADGRIDYQHFEKTL